MPTDHHTDSEPHDPGRDVLPHLFALASAGHMHADADCLTCRDARRQLGYPPDFGVPGHPWSDPAPVPAVDRPGPYSLAAGGPELSDRQVAQQEERWRQTLADLRVARRERDDLRQQLVELADAFATIGRILDQYRP